MSDRKMSLSNVTAVLAVVISLGPCLGGVEDRRRQRTNRSKQRTSPSRLSDRERNSTTAMQAQRRS
jgi:hypothetical protein